MRASRGSRATLAEGLKGSGIAGPRSHRRLTIGVSRAHRQRLRDRAAGPIDQLVGSEGFTQWSWYVSPKSPGEQLLGLRVILRIKLEGQAEERKQATFISHRVQVRPNLARSILEFVTQHAQWLATGIVIPLLGFAWHTWRQRARATPATRARRRSTTSRRPRPASPAQPASKSGDRDGRRVRRRRKPACRPRPIPRRIWPR